jgi:hypothetical protein
MVFHLGDRASYINKYRYQLHHLLHLDGICIYLYGFSLYSTLLRVNM